MIWLLVCYFVLSGYTVYATDDQQNSHAEPRKTDHFINTEFLYILGATLEDGFFGGVKWGIAAAFYHAIYRILAIGLDIIPITLRTMKGLYADLSDSITGLPPALDIHELRVLVGLLTEAIKEYEALGIPSGETPCALLCTRTLSAVMHHIHQYVSMRMPRYESQSADREIFFFITLIGNTIQSIIDCIECLNYHREVIGTSKTTIIVLNKLIDLLQGPALEGSSFDPSMAWFSG